LVESVEPPTEPRDVYTSAPAEPDLATSPGPPPDDPEAELKTPIGSADRQEALETKVLEPPPRKKAQSTNRTRAGGLPDSRVARGVEDTFLEIKRFVLRLGRIGRLAFFSHAVVVIGAVCPWFYVPHHGYTPGVERWGWLPLVLSLAGMGTLLWRFRSIPKSRVIPVLVHLVLASSIVLSLLWIYRSTVNMPDHLEPHFAAGIYLSALGAAGAALGAILGLKDIR
jgi:hypothetical protein